MSGRLVSWPVGLRTVSREPLSGPRSVGPSSQQSVSGFVQTAAAPFGLWRYQFSFEPLKGKGFRSYRGWITSLHGGANATRVPFCDWDGLTYVQAGAHYTTQQIAAGLPWSNERTWAGGETWAASRPHVQIAQSNYVGDTQIRLVDQYYGHSLDVGDQIGVFPLHFGKYMITEKLDVDGRYRIWPPLRKDVDTNHYATLTPVLAMRLESENAATAARGPARADNLVATFVEVPDYDVRAFFTD